MMSLFNLSEIEARGLGKRHMESLELWLKRLVEDTLSRKYGDEYFTYEDDKGNKLINNKITSAVSKRFDEDKEKRYARWVDATLLNNLIDIICNPKLFPLFRDALLYIYPDGHMEARTFMERLLEPRNKLSHSNPISIRELERIICYSNDIIDSLKLYYKSNNMENDYNVPTIIRVIDSFGNEKHLKEGDGSNMFDYTKNINSHLRPGDEISIEIDVDSAFDETEYSIIWNVGSEKSKEQLNNKLVYKIKISDVNTNFNILCTIISKEPWHRRGSYDDRILFVYRVLQPKK